MGDFADATSGLALTWESRFVCLGDYLQTQSGVGTRGLGISAADRATTFAIVIVDGPANPLASSGADDGPP
jgi:hypothetical protein